MSTESSWGIELWDQTDNILKYAMDQHNITDAYIRMFNEVQKLQYDFGKRLRKTVSAYIPKKRPEIESSANTALNNLIEHLSNMGSIFEVRSKELGDKVVVGLRSAYESEKKNLDTHRNTSARLQQTVESSRKKLENIWLKYVMSFKEKQKAYENWQKADKDMQLPRIEQQKAHDMYRRKVHSFEQQKAHYADELLKYNKDMRQHYNSNLVELLEEIECKGRASTVQIKSLLDISNEIHDGIADQLTQCFSGMKESVAAMDQAQDAEKVKSNLASQYLSPVELPFIDLDKLSTTLFDGPMHALGARMLGIDPSQQSGQLPGSGVQAGGGGIIGNLKRTNRSAKDDFVNLRSPFVCDFSIHGVKLCDFTIVQLDERLKEMRESVKHAEHEIQGSQRLLDAYEANSAMGDSITVAPKIECLNRRIASLNRMISELESQFTKVGGNQALAESQSALIGSRSDSPRGSTGYRDSLSESDEFASDNSGGSEVSRKTSSVNPSGPQSAYVGYAIAKFEYEGSGGEYLRAVPGQRFHIIEADTANSGWTSVVTEDGNSRGFVPTAFIDATFF